MPEAINTISADLDIRLNDTHLRKERERANSFTHRATLSTQSPRLTQSQVYSKKPREQPSPRPRPIPEDEPATFHIEDEIRLESTRTSMQSGRSTKSKRSSKSSRSTRAHSNRGLQNEAEDNLPNSNRSSGTNFDRSSSRNTSVNSRLTVTREQYWFFSKWSPCEKKLGVSIAVLVTLIIILAIIIGVLATQDDSVEK